MLAMCRAQCGMPAIAVYVRTQAVTVAAILTRLLLFSDNSSLDSVLNLATFVNANLTNMRC